VQLAGTDVALYSRRHAVQQKDYKGGAMASIPSAQARSGYQPLLGVVLALAAVLALWFIRKYVLHYWLDMSQTSFTGYFWARRAGLLPHSAGGVLALSSGVVQIWLGLTGRTGALHRTLGKVYCAGVLVGSVGGFYMALTIPPAHFAYAGGLFVLSAVWLLTTTMAVIAIHNRQFEQHREWMLRSYTVTFAFATFRLIYDYWVIPPEGTAWADDFAAFLAWACWVVPLVVLEAALQLRKVSQRA
jgi:uncharacterized membrane protein